MAELRRFRNLESQALSNQVDDEVHQCLDYHTILSYITDYLAKCGNGVELYIHNDDRSSETSCTEFLKVA